MHDDLSSERDAWDRVVQRAVERNRGRYDPGILLTQREVCVFLIRSACDYDEAVCEDTPCEVCDGFYTMWHDIYAALDAANRLGVEEALAALDIPTPRRRRHGGF